MALISARGLHKAYGPQAILADANLTIEDGERVGLVGINGSGKTTLLRILAGLEAPDSGEVARRRELRCGYLEQTPALTAGRTVIEEVLSGLAEHAAAQARFDALSAELAGAAPEGDAQQALLSRQAEAASELERLGGWEVSHRARAVLERLGVTQLDAKVERLSGGEQRRVALARVLVGRPRLMLLDEPTNHLDLAAIEWLEAHLRDELAGGLLLITHDRALLDHVAQRTLELDRGRLHAYAGGYEAFLEAKAERLANESRAEANRQRFVRQELEWLRRQPKARTGKQKARIQRAEAAIAAVPVAQQRGIRLELDAPRSSKRVLELAQLGLELGGRALVRDLDFLLLQGQRLGVVGPNGCGKTTLLRAITGELAPTRGAVRRSPNTALAYLDQTRAGLDDGAAVLDAVADGEHKVQVGGRLVDVEAFLARLLFPQARLTQKVGSLSGGERTRVALARMLCQPANLVILDEPTNDLDVPTIAALEQLLVEQASTAIVVTHDRWFLDRVATALLVFEGDGRVTPYEGNYEIYRRLRAAQQREAQAAAQAQGAAMRQREARSAASRPPRLTYDEQRELGGLLDRVEAADARVTALEAKLADPQTYAAADARGEAIVALSAELEQARAEAAALLMRWETLEQKREAAKG